MRVIAAGRPLEVEGDTDSLAELELHRREEMRAGLGLPLSLFGETLGALCVGYRRDYAVQARDIRLALTLAGHAAVAISNARLHRALRERSRELERAYEELRWSAQARERFFAAMSHELRTPLSAVLGYQEILLEGLAGDLPEELRPHLASAQRAAETLLRLVNDVLDFSRLEAGKLEAEYQPVVLPALVEEALGSVQPMARSKGLRLETRLPPDLGAVETDPDRLRQILVNLLSNAVKFTPAGEVEVSAALLDGARLEIRVRDSGPGIAPDDQERIFHEFEQVAGVSARGGSGLGLAISRRLARLLGGELGVCSEPGAGSTFVLLLPVCPPGTRVAPE